MKKPTPLALPAATFLLFAGTVFAEKGFQSIFDGKSLEGWDGMRMDFWSVQDGAITAQSTEDKPCTSNQFLVWQGGDVADFEIILKFRLADNKGNSGIQFRSKISPEGLGVGYQADILPGGAWLGCVCDEHATRDVMLAANGQKTVIDAAGNRTTASLGAKAKLKKPGEWNDYHVTARGNHITLVINGTKCAEVIDDQTDYFDASGILGLQLRSGPPMKVQFKDIFLKRDPIPSGTNPKPSVEPKPDPTPAADEAGFTTIFDGKSLAGWKAPNMSYWSVSDGAITGQSTEDKPCKTNQTFVWQGGDVEDFELKLKFRFREGPGNSGIQFRSKISPEGINIGYEADILPGGPWLGAVVDEHAKRDVLLASNGQKTVIAADGKRTTTDLGGKVSLRKSGEWNDYHITARGNHIVLKVNGKRSAEVIDHETGEFDLKGILGLQLLGGPPMKVQFKDIRLKRLGAAKPQDASNS